jgi:hypothetical protein
MSTPATSLRWAYLMRRGGFFVLLFTVFWSLGLAVIFTTADSDLRTIPTAYLIALVGQRPGGVAVLLVTAGFGAYGLRHPGLSWRGVGAMMPQVILVFMSAFSAFFSAMAGHYPDGTVPVSAHHFIAADQLWTILIAFLHAACVVVYNGGGSWSSAGS